MNINLDSEIIYKNGNFEINKTILFTWIIMFIIISISIILKIFIKSKKDTKLQTFFEILITIIQEQINKMGNFNMKYVFPYIATIFLFILFSNLISIIPFFTSPTASLSTTIALTISVFVFAIIYGICNKGLKFFKKYIEPSPILLPLNIIGDISSNFSLTIRLYGNIMAGMVIGSIISKIAFLSFGFPIFLNLLSLISGSIQAYIYSTLALMFINS